VIPDRSIPAELAASYACCRELHRRHGRTYYLATRLLPRWKRPHVHALYGFTRYTDNIVDEVDRAGAAGRADRLTAWAAAFTSGLDGGPVDEPVISAVLYTLKTFALDRADFEAFLRSMAMDLAVSTYDTYADLLEYMAGSAAAIGSMMLPILGARDVAGAREPARQLGLAFQLTNFIRDVGEDFERGRIYLPLKDLAEFGVTPDDLRDGRPTPAIRRLIAAEVDRAREHYAQAAPGIPMLDLQAQSCIRAAYLIYGRILDEVVRADYDVFTHRATVPNARRLALAASCLLTRPGRPVRTVPGRADAYH
jgi:15-cis-phytoene synthase